MTQEITTTEPKFNDLIPWTPEDVSAAWRRANSGMRSVLAFGALLADIESSFPREHARNQYNEVTLKLWLDENCPEVNYNTARGYKRLASIAAGSIGCSVGDLHNLPSLAEAEHLELSKSELEKATIIDKYLTGATKRSILNDFVTSKPGALPGAERKAPRKLTPEEAEGKLAELANHGITSARNALVEIAGNKELLMRLERTMAAALLKDIKRAIQRIAEEIA